MRQTIVRCALMCALVLAVASCASPRAGGAGAPTADAAKASTAHSTTGSMSGLMSGLWMPKNDHDPYGQALIDRLPKGTHILTDTGPAPELPIGDFGGLKVTQRALDEVAHFDPAKQRSPAEACIPPSMTYLLQSPFPIEMHVFPDVIILKHEYYDIIRIIFMDGRKHPPADVPHTKAGHSVGHWEGDDLVVDTTHIAAATMFNNGFNHSDDIHVVERFRVSPDGSTLWVTQLYEDPTVFEGLAARYIAFKRGPPDGFVYPFDCDPSYSSE